MSIFEKNTIGKIITILVGVFVCFLAGLVWDSNGRLIKLEKDMEAQKENSNTFRLFVSEQTKINSKTISLALMIESLDKKVDNKFKNQQTTLDLLLKIALEQKRASSIEIDSSPRKVYTVCLSKESGELKF